MTSHTARFRILLATLGLALQPYLTCPAQEPSDMEVRTIQGLAGRRLYDLAVSYADRILDDPQTSGLVRVDVAVALIDTLAQKAYQSPNPEDWQVARQTAADWQQKIQSPREILISVQAALVDQLQVEKWVRELETDTAAAGTREQAQAAIAGLAARLADLQEQTRSLLNQRPSPREEAEWFTPNELLTLRYNLEYQQARCQMHRAALYDDAEELNRKDVLLQVRQQLNSVLQSLRPDQPLWWAVQADRLTIARSLDDYKEAAQIVNGLPASQGALSGRQQVQAEWIRTLVRQRRLEEAVALAGKDSQACDSPVLDLTRLELFVALATQSGERIWQERALELTRNMESTHGGYWGRLANLAVVGNVSQNSATGTNLDFLVRVADEAQRKKQWPQALQALDAAYQQALVSNQADAAWKLGFRAASIAQTQGHHEVAAQRFTDLATRHSDLPAAHTGLLMACWNLTRGMSGNPARIQQYESQLVQLIESWPQSSSADQARIWLAAIRRHQENWPAAIGLLLDVSAASPLFDQAVQDLRDVTGQLLRDPALSLESRSNVCSALIVRLSPLIETPAASLPDNWQDTRARIILQLVELQTLFDRQLKSDLTGPWRELVQNPDTPADIQPSVAALDFIRQERPLRWGNTPEDKVNQLQIILQGLFPDPESGNRQQKCRRLLAAAETFAAEIQQLPEPLRRQWTNATIDCLIFTERPQEAIELASDLANQYPKDAAVQLRLAELLNQQAAGSPSALAEALGQWRKIARFSRANSEHWYRAKYEVARLLVEQGNSDEALKLLNFIRAVPPGWSEASNAPAFDELLRSLGGN